MDLKTTTFRAHPWLRIGLIAIACGTLLLVAQQIVAPLDHPNSDFFKFWLAAQMNWSERNPYLPHDWVSGHSQFGSTWLPEQTFLYPLPLGVLLAPLGLFAVQHAFVIWVFLSELMIIAAVRLILALQNDQRVNAYILPIFVGVCLFRPVLVTLWSGQLSAIFLLALALAIWCWERGRWWQGGAALALLALKPTLGGPLFLLIGLWLLAKRHWHAPGGLLGAGMALLLVGMIRNPWWVTEFLAIGNNRLVQSFGFSPTVWGVATIACANNLQCAVWGGGAAAVLLVGGSAVVLFQQRDRLAPRVAVSLAIPVCLLVTPYIWAYDQTLLIIPIVVVMLTLLERDFPFLITAGSFLAIDFIAIVCSTTTDTLGHDVWSVAVPVVVFGMVAMLLRWSKPV